VRDRRRQRDPLLVQPGDVHRRRPRAGDERGGCRAVHLRTLRARRGGNRSRLPRRRNDRDVRVALTTRYSHADQEIRMTVRRRSRSAHTLAARAFELAWGRRRAVADAKRLGKKRR